MLRPVADVLKKLIPVSIRSPLIEGGELKASEGREEGIGFTAVYDACVLYPAPLRDLLMHLAMTAGPSPKSQSRVWRRVVEIAE